MIGWYVHHQGLGHLHRVRAVHAELESPVTVLSTLTRPDDWEVPWVDLARDDGEEGLDGRDADAGGHLHWAPLNHEGLRRRMASVSAWIAERRPSLVVSDVSVEVALLCRLHGVPLVYVAMPGSRADAAHRLGYGVATELVGCWPEEAAGMVMGIRDADQARMRLVGAVSRFPVAAPRIRRPGPCRVTVLLGGGGHELRPEMLDAARAEATLGEICGALKGEWGIYREPARF